MPGHNNFCIGIPIVFNKNESGVIG